MLIINPWSCKTITGNIVREFGFGTVLPLRIAMKTTLCPGRPHLLVIIGVLRKVSFS